MSADVFIQAIRKDDGCPFERIYLGGNSLVNEIRYDKDTIDFETTVMGCHVAAFSDSSEVKQFLDKYSEQIYGYGGCGDIEEYPQPLEDFHYWLVIEA